jgi:cytochrome c
MIRYILPSLAVAVIVAAPHYAHAADATKGKEIFAQCAICHSLKPGENKVGPSLHGVFGRKAGTEAGFEYSDAMKKSGITWDATTLTKYVSDPQAVVPGNKMPFPGIKDPSEVQDLVAYLEQATK